MTITALAQLLDVRLEIAFMPTQDGTYYWRCHMRCVAFPAKRGHHRSVYGWGATSELALRNFVSLIRGKRVIVHPYPNCEKRSASFEYDIPVNLTK